MPVRTPEIRPENIRIRINIKIRIKIDETVQKKISKPLTEVRFMPESSYRLVNATKVINCDFKLTGQVLNFHLRYFPVSLPH